MILRYSGQIYQGGSHVTIGRDGGGWWAVVFLQSGALPIIYQKQRSFLKTKEVTSPSKVNRPTEEDMSPSKVNWPTEKDISSFKENWPTEEDMSI